MVKLLFMSLPVTHERLFNVASFLILLSQPPPTLVQNNLLAVIVDIDLRGLGLVITVDCLRVPVR